MIARIMALFVCGMLCLFVACAPKAAVVPEEEEPIAVAAPENENPAPPAEPEKNLPPPVRGLKAERENDHVRLTWALADKTVDRYVIYRCLEGSMGRPCRDCPQHFQCIAVFQAKDAEVSSGKGAFVDQPPGPGGFTYKIKALDKDGVAGTDSEHVTIRYFMQK